MSLVSIVIPQNRGQMKSVMLNYAAKLLKGVRFFAFNLLILKIINSLSECGLFAFSAAFATLAVALMLLSRRITMLEW
ncbi:hypothetical protein [Pantoea alhagi]|nr:hypothetical protein [Pantoea alhagi]